MTDRIHRYLDGELPREALGPEELEDLAAYEAAISGVLADLPDSAGAPDLAPFVLQRIREGGALGASDTPEARGAMAASAGSAGSAGSAESAGSAGSAGSVLPRFAFAGRLLDWLWAPQTVTLRPAWAFSVGVALAVILGVSIAVSLDGGLSGAPSSEAVGDPTPRVYVHFRLDASGASTVALAGDFTDWEPVYELHQGTPGVWSVVVPLEPGVHDYAFVVDGERWVPDPLAAQVDDGFGGTNSRLSVLPPEPRRQS